MILRDEKGSVMFAAHRRLFYCNDAIEAELHALKESIDLTIHRTHLPVLISLNKTCWLNRI